jgi:hypothetical protein
VIRKIKHPRFETTIAVVGKYVSLIESYKSLTEALIHGARRQIYQALGPMTLLLVGMIGFMLLAGQIKVAS